MNARRQQRRDLALRVARVSALLFGLGAAATLLLAYRVKAYSERVLLGLGDHMMRYAGADNQTTPLELRINGATLLLSNASVDAPLEAVLDHFHDKCVRKNGQLRAQLEKARAADGRTVSGQRSLADGVLRVEAGRQGALACFETGDEPLSPAELMQRIERALQTGDVSQLGRLRYVKAREGERGTFFLAIWSEGALNLREMFPEQGDAPGRDPEGIPRPENTRRLLSAEPSGTSSLVNVYTSHSQNARALREFYGERLPAHGFRLLEREGRSSGALLVASDGARMVTLSFGDDESGRGIVTAFIRPD